MDICYKDLKVTINKIDEITINDKSLDVLDITIDNGNLINLGRFYSDIILNDNIEYFIENLDKIMLQNCRYIGTDEDVINYLLVHTKNNIIIRDMYLEYINTPLSSPQYEKYRRFFELYFCNNEVPDEIKEVFLQKEGKKVLDYTDIDSEIKKEFNGSIGRITVEKEHELDIKECNKLKLKLDSVTNEVYLLEKIINKINEIIDTINLNVSINRQIEEIYQQMDGMFIFDKRKKKSKLEINILKEKIIPINLKDAKDDIKKLINEYAISFNDSYGLNILCDNMSFGDLLTIISDIHKNKLDICNKTSEKYKNLSEKLNNYDGCVVDISDLYERINKVKV